MRDRGSRGDGRSRARRLGLWAVLMMALALALAACASASTVCTEQLNGPEILHYGVGDPFHSLDPAHALSPLETQTAMLVFPGLLTLDQNLDPIPSAAARMPELDASGMVYTLHLRSGMKWSDGGLIDANTFAYSLDRLANPCTRSEVAAELSAIKGAAAFSQEQCVNPTTRGVSGPIQTLVGDSLIAMDPLTLRVTLARPASFFLSALASPALSAVPQTLIAQYYDAWTDHLASSGSGFGGGPFVVTTWDHYGSLVLSPNAGFFAGAPKLRRIAITIYNDEETVYADYLAGKNDFVAVPIAHLTDASVHSGYQSSPALETRYLQPNWTVAPFDDARARQAFALAIDKQALLDSIYGAAAMPTNHTKPSEVIVE